MVAGGEHGDRGDDRMCDGDGAHPPRRRQRPQCDAAPDRPRHVQRRHGGVQVGLRRLEVVGRGQQAAHRVVETGQHARRRDGIDPVDGEAHKTRNDENIAMSAVAVAAHPQQQQDERRHAEMHDEVVRRQRLADGGMSSKPVVHRLCPGKVPRTVEMQHGSAMSQARGRNVTVQLADFVVAGGEADDENDLKPPPGTLPDQWWKPHGLHPASGGAWPEAQRQKCTPRAAMKGSGSIATPLTCTSKCRCGPVEKPVLPSRPMTVPAVTQPEVRTNADM